jgi:type VI secretion system protein ImpJ
LPVAPREIPYQTGTTYFELDRSGDMWRRMNNSVALAIHIGGEWPDLALELWAIRSKSSADVGR